jgi:3-oxoacyl-[acyl-carrier-protein] synthase-3
MVSFSKIVGTGTYLPEKVISNDQISQIVFTTDSWIRQRVGISKRHICTEYESTFYMAYHSAKKALKDANIDCKLIKLIVVATTSADYIMPSLSSMLQGALNIPDCLSFDINAACSGFIHAIDIAKQYIESSSYGYALIVASERMSRMLNWKDRSTCILFGDASASVVLSKSKVPGIITSSFHTDSSGMNTLNMPNFFSKTLYETSLKKKHLFMQGSKVFKYAVSNLANLVETLLFNANLSLRDIDWFIPHQANYRILESLARKLKLPIKRVITTLSDHGNTSSASIPLALDHALRNRVIKKGDLVISVAFGSGFVWGGMIVRI